MKVGILGYAGVGKTTVFSALTGHGPNVNVPGEGESLNVELEKAGRVADFLEFGELMCRDALERRESCGGHFREEWQDGGEARRDDDSFAHVAVWEHRGPGQAPVRHTESLEFENVHLAVRSYK